MSAPDAIHQLAQTAGRRADATRQDGAPAPKAEATDRQIDQLVYELRP